MSALNEQHLANLVERQREIEEDMRRLGLERYRTQFDKAMTKNRFDETYPGTILTKMSIESFARSITDWKNEALGGGRGRRNRSALKINEMDPYGVAYVSIRVIMAWLYRRMTLTQLAVKVGKAIMDEARFQTFAVEAPALMNKIEETGKRNGYDTDRRRTVLIYSMNKFNIPFDTWSETERLQLGVKMIELYADVSGFIAIEQVPNAGVAGFHHIVSPTEAVLKFVEDRNHIGELMRPSYLPTVLPPKRWSSGIGGGYHFDITDPLPLINVRPDNKVKFPKNVTMPTVFAGINAIQETAWKVNTKVLDVLVEMWTGNMDLPGVPSRKNIKVPPYPVGGTDEQIARWKKEARDIHDLNAKSQGRRLQMAMTIDMAERMRNDEAIYFPHTLDFRGRAYPKPACLTPQGADYSKALLHIANGKPLGDYEALRWLAIHGANTFGEDKISLEDRVQWTFDHEEEILWCAEDPIKFDWWHQADKPFNFLAFCFEWQSYKKHGLNHVSHLPIAQDGTCNGLQHFSAMLRDSVGGAAVNLVPSDKPRDIYGTVAEKTIELLRMPQEDEQHRFWAEAWLAFGIDRKITKRPVMVLPYGGSFRSCVDYIGLAVREKIQEGKATDPFGSDLPKAIGFLAKKVWEAIGHVVVAARQAMSWLQKVARIAAKHDITMQWTTPSGFTVSQRYVKQDKRRVRTQLFGETTYLSLSEQTDELAEHKQALAVSPNFVHSLDAAVMMRTIERAVEEGITDFAMIHDSYGTLAADTPKLANLIREEFVRMYEEHNVLEEFREDILALLPEEARAAIPPVPAKGSLILRDVLRSDFFFS